MKVIWATINKKKAEILDTVKDVGGKQIHAQTAIGMYEKMKYKKTKQNKNKKKTKKKHEKELIRWRS